MQRCILDPNFGLRAGRCGYPIFLWLLRGAFPDAIFLSQDPLGLMRRPLRYARLTDREEMR
jgi:hypothetical protein